MDIKGNMSTGVDCAEANVASENSSCQVKGVISSHKKVFPIFDKNFRTKSDPLKSIQLSIKKSPSATSRRRILLSSKEPPGMLYVTVIISLSVPALLHLHCLIHFFIILKPLLWSCILIRIIILGLSQALLDAGQKKIGPTYCEECGLLYSPGDYEDEKIHKKAHQRLDNLYSVQVSSNEDHQ